MSEILGLPLILIGALNGALVTLLLLVRRNFTPAIWVLCGFITVLLLRLVVYALGAENIFDPHSWLYVPPIEVSLAYGPCIYLFITYQTQRGFRRKDFLHLAPFVLQIIYYSSLLFLPNASLNSWVTTAHIPWLSKIELLIVGTSLAVYLWLSFFRFSRYQNWIEQEFSDAENYRLHWPLVFLVLTGVFAFVWSVFAAMQFWATPSYASDYGLFAIQSIMVTLLALETWRSSALRFPLQLDGNNDVERKTKITKNQNDKLESVYKNCNEQLEHYEWWKEPQLTLAQLAQRLGTNTTTLSNAINEVRQQNFNQFINAIRVRHVCETLKSDIQHQSLLDVGLEAGFNSKNSFNRNFKKFTGATPSEYKRKISSI